MSLKGAPSVAIVALGAALMAVPAFGQGLVIAPPASTADIAAASSKADAAKLAADAALAAAQAATTKAQQACQPMPAIPPPEAVGGAAGSGTACRLATSVQPRINRTASCTFTISGGAATCTTTWEGGAFPTGSTIRLAGAPAIVDTGAGAASEQPITCKAYSLTLTGVGFRCWQGVASTVSVLGATVLPFAAPTQSATVQVTAILSS